MLIWVDLYPNWRFAHPTLYILISGEESRIVEGEWWPVLNGERILYGVPSNYAIVSPFIKENSSNSNPAEESPPLL
jgi:hypothetical protein